MRLDVCPDKACYRPGEPVKLLVTLAVRSRADVQIVASITFLAGEVACLGENRPEKPLLGPVSRPSPSAGGLPTGWRTVELAWQPPPDAPRGYGVDVRAMDATGRPVATASTAFDVLERWTQAPRYGFLTDFAPGRSDIDETMAWLARYHVNGLQFYDWMYRHDRLLPPGDIFDDPLGRRLSLATVEQLIDAAHSRGIAAMPYSAVYAASPPFFRQHRDWALLDAGGQPIPFAGGFLMIMNPAAGSPWTRHLLAQFGEVLEQTRFDGIHLDQYGEPKTGYDAGGKRVDLAQALPALIDAARRVAGPERAVIFNCVGNWPVEAVAPAAQDAVYIEVWPPDTQLQDLHRLIVEGQRLGRGKPVILAAYIDPAYRHSVLLSEAIIMASGGFHIALGELGGYLADPYFPKYGRLDAALAAALRHFYDFAVRYENVLSQDARDTTANQAGRLAIAGIHSGPALDRGQVGVITRQGPGFEAVSLINLLGVSEPRWDAVRMGKTILPTGLAVRYYTGRAVQRAWWATPDEGDLRAQPLAISHGHDGQGRFVAFVVPRLRYWDLIVLEGEG